MSVLRAPHVLVCNVEIRCPDGTGRTAHVLVNGTEIAVKRVSFEVVGPDPVTVKLEIPVHSLRMVGFAHTEIVQDVLVVKAGKP